MQSENFQFLEDRWPELAKQASFAEQYVHDDPSSATIKLRCFAETLVGILYRELQLPIQPDEGFFEKLKAERFENLIEHRIRQKLHAIRQLGNKAAHGGEIGKENAGQLVKEAYLLALWLHRTYSGNATEHYPGFTIPRPQEKVNVQLSAENDQLARQLEQAKQDLAEVQAAEHAAQQKLSDMNASVDEARLETFRNASARATNTMDFDQESTRRLIRIEDAFAEYSLNESQTELVGRLGEFLSSKTHSAFLLRGYAGTGKTFITKGLTEYFRSIGRNYVLAAPTGKAAKVIANKTKSPAHTLHKTIYSFKDIIEYRDDDEAGTETYKFYSQLAVNEMSADTVFIVDEASMVSDVYNEAEFFRFGSGYLLQDFLKFVNLDHNDHRKKVIFIGDDAQLPPVGMNTSPALDAGYLSREYAVRSTGCELTEVVRQGPESGVMRNSLELRKALRNGVFNQLTADVDCPDVAKVKHANLMDRYLETCGGRINGESIVIAHSNAAVAAYNRRIREQFFPGTQEVTAGDKVMAVSNSSAHGFFISNGDFGLIRKVLGDAEKRAVPLRRKNGDTGEVEKIVVPLEFRDVEIGFRDENGAPHFFEAKIVEGLLYSDHPNLSSDENKALYVDFCMRNPDLKRGSLEFKNALMSDPFFSALKLKFGYAITCHKAQGSEWNHVFVNCKTHQRQLSADYFRWFYTAITRTSRNLWLLDPPNIKIGNGIKAVNAPGIQQPQPSQNSAQPEEKPAQRAAGPGQRDEHFTDQPATTVKQSGAQRGEESDTLGIPKTRPFLIALLRRVRELLAGTDVGVEAIDHFQYREAYGFRRGDDQARVDISYNGKEKITGISSPEPSDFSLEVQGLLATLKGMPIAREPEVAASEIRFDEDFLNELHERVIPLTAARQIKIQNAERYQWNLRYTFTRGNEIAVYDLFFNGQHRFTKCDPVTTACTPGELVEEVQHMLTEGLSS